LKYRKISIKKGIADAVEEFVQNNPRFGYRSMAEFAEDAIRKRAEALGIISTISGPRFIHFNVYEDRVSIIDNEQPEGKSWVDVYLQNGKAWCDLCEKHDCDHTRFALGLPKVVDALTAKGWAVEDGKVVRGPL